MIYQTAEKAFLPGALAAYADVVARGVAHRWILSPHSSQAFALNLFAPLDAAGRRGVFALAGIEAATVDPPVFEWTDPADRLHEGSSRSAHLTQVDVLLRGMSPVGERLVALIEVKLTEADFSWCSAYASPANPRLDVCRSAGLFGGHSEQCFQLANHGHGRRLYDKYLAGVAASAEGMSGGCALRKSLNQPMRNLALASMLVDEDDADQAVYVVCAPAGHRAIWRRFDEIRTVFADKPLVTVRGATAEQVATLTPGHAAALSARYASAEFDWPVPDTDAEMLAAATVTTDFGTHCQPISVLVVWMIEGGWHPSTVLYRDGAGPVQLHPRWDEPFPLSGDTSLDGQWAYLVGRYDDCNSGNWYTWYFNAFEVACIEDAAAIVNLAEAKAAEETANPPPVTVTDESPNSSEDQTPDAIDTPDGCAAAFRGPLRLARVSVPAWVESPDEAGAPSRADMIGGEAAWNFAVPWVFRVLAAPASYQPLPASPRPGEFTAALGYWTALLHMLIYSLGWARPDRGLQWWYDIGKPGGDLRLRLLSEVWDRDGQLDWFAAWLWTTNHLPELEPLAELTGYRDDGCKVSVDQRWVNDNEIAMLRSNVAVPGTYHDELHLGYHCGGPLMAYATQSSLTLGRGPDLRATLVCDSMIGWYRALALAGRTLPSSAQPWQVDVFVRPVGWLGTYRRSSTSGLWFSGRHRYHLPGT